VFILILGIGQTSKFPWDLLAASTDSGRADRGDPRPASPAMDRDLFRTDHEGRRCGITAAWPRSASRLAGEVRAAV
jgi:hypothetical protein